MQCQAATLALGALGAASYAIGGNKNAAWGAVKGTALNLVLGGRARLSSLVVGKGKVVSSVRRAVSRVYGRTGGLQGRLLSKAEQILKGVTVVFGVERDRANRVGLAAIGLALAVPLSLHFVPRPWSFVLVGGGALCALAFVLVDMGGEFCVSNGILRKRRMLLSDVTLSLDSVDRIEVQWIPRGPSRLYLWSESSVIDIAVVDSTADLRRVLGSELRRRGRVTTASAAVLSALEL